MVSDKVQHDQSAHQPSATLIPVQVEQVDQLVAIARDLAGFLLILDAAATGDPTLAAVERILEPINEQLRSSRPGSIMHGVWQLPVLATKDKESGNHRHVA